LFVGCCLVRLRIPSSRTLKDKRQVVRSLIERVHNKFEVAIAEVGRNDKHGVAVLGIASVSNESHHARETIDTVLSFIEQARPDCDVQVQALEVTHIGE
jgi:uncharacterized protein